MKFWAGFAVFVVVLIAGYQWQLGRLHFARDPASLNGSTCDGKKFCAVVYLAPWCPHCRAELGHTQALLAQSKTGDTGIRAIVGMEQRPGDNAAMARSIASQGVQLDTDGAIAQALHINSVPAIVVLDKEGTTIIDGPEAREWVMDKFGH